MKYDVWPTIALADMAGEMASVIGVPQLVYLCHISLRRRFLYVETPKAGCSSTKLTLQRLELDDPTRDFADYQLIHLREYSPLLNPLQVGDFRAIVDGPFFKFCFVRNPYTRLLSAYLDKIVRAQPQKAAVLRLLGRPAAPLDQDVSFAEFLAAVCDTPFALMDVHWLPQTHLTMHAHIRYDVVGRFESFEADLAKIVARLGAEPERYMARSFSNRTEAGAALAKHYTPALADQVYETFRIDFETFGYERTLPN